MHECLSVFFALVLVLSLSLFVKFNCIEKYIHTRNLNRFIAFEILEKPEISISITISPYLRDFKLVSL